MADNQLQINIGADTRNLEQGLDRAKTEITDFDKSLKVSGTGLVDFENKAKQGGKAAGDFSGKLKDTQAVSGKASTSLLNLARVAQDAPFGFIAISNNLDPLLQSLSSFSNSTDDAKVKSKALLSALTGGAGLALGFSLITGLLTVLTQKYGGLGKAIDAIFGKTTSLDKQIQSAAKSLEKYNDAIRSGEEITRAADGEVAGQISRVQALAQVAGDQTIAYDKRNAALKELERINKTYFENLKIEDGRIVGLTDSVNKYTASLVASARAKGFEQEISKLAPVLAEQQALLNNLTTARNNVRESGAKPLPGIGTAIFTETQIATAAVKTQQKEVDKLQARYKFLNDELTKLVGAQLQDTLATQAATEAARQKAEQERKQAEDARLAAAAIKLKTDEQTKLNAATKAYNDLVAREQLFKARLQTVDIPQSQLPQLTIPATISPVVPQSTLDSFQAFIAAQNDALSTKKIQESANAFNSILGPAIDGVFSAIENGQNVIQSLGQSIKRLVIDLIKATIKAAAFAAVISLASGGTISFGTAFRGVTSIGGGGGIPQLSRTAAPSFGGVAGFGGGLQLAGQVVFTQRGTDLVGVLNSSNARINRVG